VHLARLVSLDEDRLVPVPAEELLQLVAADPRRNGGTGDLVSVEMEDREHRAIVDRVQEFVRVPAGCQGGRFELSVPDDATGQQIRVVEDRPVGVGQAVAELTPFMDRAGRLGGRVTRDASRKGELLEETS
jgi:hypothetical protein